MKDKILDIIFPRTCPICLEIVKQKGQLICDECKNEVIYIKEPKCRKCGKGLKTDDLLCTDCKEHHHEYNQGVCVFEYAGPLKKSMYKFKYENIREFADFYGNEATKRYGKLFEKWKIDCIIPVPVFKGKEKIRGYNQAKVFARSVSKFTNIPILEKCLIRVRDTTPQKELVGIKRKQNLENAFAIFEQNLNGIENILIVDDIYTTGSTIDACSKVLKAAGIKKVYFLCVSTGNL